MEQAAVPENRYARHHLIDWWDQDRLRAARVMVAGAGALGNEAVKLLALMGVGHILIVDFDQVEVSNLTRSVLFRESDIGRDKAEVAAERARQINPDVDVRCIQGDLEFDVGLGVYRAMNIVLGCLDSLNARLALNRACRRVGVPWVNAGIEATVAEVALFDGEQGACFECAMSETMWERRSRRFSCGGLQSDAAENKMPTTAIVASLAAAYMVNEALYLLHADVGKPKAGLAFGQKLYLVLKPYGFHIMDLPVNSHCLAHDRWEPIEVLAQSPKALTVAELLRLTGAPGGRLELGFDLLTEMRCLQCDARETILRPVERCGLELTYCPRCCAASRRPETVSWLEADSEFADRPLSELGVPEYQIVAIKDAEERHYLQMTGEYPDFGR